MKFFLTGKVFPEDDYWMELPITSDETLVILVRNRDSEIVDGCTMTAVHGRPKMVDRPPQADRPAEFTIRATCWRKELCSLNVGDSVVAEWRNNDHTVILRNGFVLVDEDEWGDTCTPFRRWTSPGPLPGGKDIRPACYDA